MWVIFLLAIFVAGECVERYQLDEESLQQEWQKYKDDLEFNIDEIEEQDRYNIFCENVKFIESHNQKYENGESSFHLGINHLTHLSNEEFKALLGFKLDEHAVNSSEIDFYDAPIYESLPASFDWRDQGAVTPVKDQGSCGSCWAFSAAQSLEGAHKKKTGQLVELSPQQILDCDRESQAGCKGGWPHIAFDYVGQAGGLHAESSYPYTGKQGPCKFNKNSVVATCKQSQMVRGEGSMASALVNNCPLSVAIIAEVQSFKLYNGGIYEDRQCNNKHVDHAVVVVGYGNEGNKDFWWLKNSWGTRWGIEGYMKMARNVQQCKLGSYITFPLV